MDGELQRGYTGEWDALKKLYDASVWNQDRNGYQDTLLQTHPPGVYDGILATWVRGENGHINKQESSEMIMTYFEEWGVRSFMGATPAALALYSVGSTTGVGVDIGEGGTSIVPVYEGYTMPHAVCQTKLGCEAVTNKLLELVQTERPAQMDNLLRSGVPMWNEGRGNEQSPKHGLQMAKKHLCFVAEDIELARRQAAEGEFIARYDLPDGSHVTLGSERFDSTEVLFGSEGDDGLHIEVCQAVMKCDCDIRPELFQNIVTCGGGGAFPGIHTRLVRDLLSTISSASTKVGGQGTRNEINAWVGGSILASNPTAQREMATTKAQFDEHGPGIIHRQSYL